MRAPKGWCPCSCSLRAYPLPLLYACMSSCIVRCGAGYLVYGFNLVSKFHTHRLYPYSTFHHLGLIISLCTPCRCSDSPGRCYDDLDRFVYLQIVPLLLHQCHSPMEVFHSNWSRAMLILLICYSHYPGLIAVGS